MSDLTSKGMTACGATRAAWANKIPPSSAQESKTDADGSKVGHSGKAQGLILQQVQNGDASAVKVTAHQFEEATKAALSETSSTSHPIKDVSPPARMFHSFAEDDELRLLSESIAFCQSKSRAAQISNPEIANQWNSISLSFRTAAVKKDQAQTLFSTRKDPTLSLITIRQNEERAEQLNDEAALLEKRACCSMQELSAVEDHHPELAAAWSKAGTAFRQLEDFKKSAAGAKQELNKELQTRFNKEVEDQEKVVRELHHLATVAENISRCYKNVERAIPNEQLAHDWNNAAEALEQLQTYMENAVDLKDHPDIQTRLSPLIEQQEKEATLFQNIALCKSNALEATEHDDEKDAAYWNSAATAFERLQECRHDMKAAANDPATAAAWTKAERALENVSRMQKGIAEAYHNGKQTLVENMMRALPSESEKADTIYAAAKKPPSKKEGSCIIS